MRQRRFDGLKQIAFVERVDQVGNHFGVGLTRKHIALGLQRAAQLVMIFYDAVVHQSHSGRAGVSRTRSMAEMRMGVVHRRSPMRGPARVSYAGVPFKFVVRHLRLQLGHARRTARPRQAAAGMHRDTAGVVAAVLQALQALYQDGNDIAVRNRADDAAHRSTPKSECTDASGYNVKYSM